MSSETDRDQFDHRITVHLDRMLKLQGMTLTELSPRTGLTMANLSILKNGKAKAIRFTTLTLICDVLQCIPQDLIGIEPSGDTQQ